MKTRIKSAFTLVELLIVVTLTGLLTTCVLGFYIQSLYANNASEQQIKLAAKMRAFMNEMIFNGSRSHELILYKSAAAADRSSTDANGDGTPDSRLVVTNEASETPTDDICPTGDFAVFVYYELPKPATASKYRIQKLVGYYIDSSAVNGPALVRMTVDFGATPSADPVETILANNWTTAPRKTIAPCVAPLALADTAVSSTPPNLFYRRAGQSLAVCGQLLASTTGRNTADRRTYTRTFYFTVTVRT